MPEDWVNDWIKEIQAANEQRANENKEGFARIAKMNEEIAAKKAATAKMKAEIATKKAAMKAAEEAEIARLKAETAAFNAEADRLEAEIAEIRRNTPMPVTTFAAGVLLSKLF
jgi:predicted RNase H-like nuclease (RuvC/YqgF family)